MATPFFARGLAILGGAVAILFVLAVALLFFLVDPTSRAEHLPNRVEVSPLSRFVNVPFAGTDGIELHYLEGGRRDEPAPTFVLLHGFTLNAFSWLPQIDRLGRHGRVIALDQLPYGLSEKLAPGDWRGAHPYSREAAVALVTALMDRLNLERVILVGNSSGGTLAAELALAIPDRVDGLVLVAPWVYVTRPVLPRSLAESSPLRRLSLLAARQLGEDMPLLARSYADPGKITTERRELARVHTRTRHWDLAWGALINRSLSTRIDLSSRVDQISQPVLVITGDRDRLVAVEDTRRVAAVLPRAQLEVLAGCGHVPHEECPDDFAEAVDGWLGTTRPGVVRPSAPVRHAE